MITAITVKFPRLLLFNCIYFLACFNVAAQGTKTASGTYIKTLKGGTADGYDRVNWKISYSFFKKGNDVMLTVSNRETSIANAKYIFNGQTYSPADVGLASWPTTYYNRMSFSVYFIIAYKGKEATFIAGNDDVMILSTGGNNIYFDTDPPIGKGTINDINLAEISVKSITFAEGSVLISGDEAINALIVKNSQKSQPASYATNGNSGSTPAAGNQTSATTRAAATTTHSNQTQQMLQQQADANAANTQQLTESINQFSNAIGGLIANISAQKQADQERINATNAAYMDDINALLPQANNGNTDAMVSIAENYWHIEAGQLKKPKPADMPNTLNWYKKAAAANNIKAISALGSTYLVSNDLQAAVYWFEKAADLGDMQAMQTTAVLYKRLKSPKADELNKKINDINFYGSKAVLSFDAKAYTADGIEQMKNAHFKEARAAFQKSILLDEQNYTTYEQLINADLQDKDVDAALKDGKNALSLFPNQAWINYLVGLAYVQKNDYPKAISYITNATSLELQDKDLLSQCFSTLGDCYHVQKDDTKSDEAYDKSLTYNTDNAYALNNYAYYLSVRGQRLDKAAEMSKRSNTLESGTASYEDTYAWILFKQKNYADARVWIEKALADDKSGSAIQQEHYGDIMFYLGNTDAAVINWKKAKEMHGKSTTLNRKIKEKKYIE